MDSFECGSRRTRRALHRGTLGGPGRGRAPEPYHLPTSRGGGSGWWQSRLPPSTFTHRVLFSVKRDAEVVVWPSVFSEAWGTKANKTCFCWKTCGLLALVPPSLPKTTWPTNNFGVPLIVYQKWGSGVLVRKYEPAGPSNSETWPNALPHLG